MRGSRNFFLASLAILLASCAHNRTTAGSSDNEAALESVQPPENSETIADEGSDTHEDAEIDIPEKKELILHSQVPMELNPEVMTWIRYFAKKERDRFESYLVRGSQYKKLIEEILKKNDLPPELYYLALIESGFVHHARSSANAVGFWQFMRPTGVQYGLRISPYVDERQDIVRATQAAAKYIKTLFNQFDDWHLALAAYNAGPGRIKHALRRSKLDNYWDLARKGYIPAETQNYVPEFMAALIIGSFPERFNFDIPEGNEIPDIQPVRVPSPIQLADLAKVSKVPLDTIKRLNPHLKVGYTPPNISRYYVWMPANLSVEPKTLSDRLLPLRKDSRLFMGGAAFRMHVVRRGETLDLIARRYRRSLTQLKHENGLRSNRIHVGQELKIPGSRVASQVTLYRVRSGDSLTAIAHKFHVAVVDIKRLNGLRGSRIHQGQSLKIAAR